MVGSWWHCDPSLTQANVERIQNIEVCLMDDHESYAHTTMFVSILNRLWHCIINSVLEDLMWLFQTWTWIILVLSQDKWKFADGWALVQWNNWFVCDYFKWFWLCGTCFRCLGGRMSSWKRSVDQSSHTGQWQTDQTRDNSPSESRWQSNVITVIYVLSDLASMRLMSSSGLLHFCCTISITLLLIPGCTLSLDLTLWLVSMFSEG